MSVAMAIVLGLCLYQLEVKVFLPWLYLVDQSVSAHLIGISIIGYMCISLFVLIWSFSLDTHSISTHKKIIYRSFWSVTRFTQSIYIFLILLLRNFQTIFPLLVPGIVLIVVAIYSLYREFSIEMIVPLMFAPYGNALFLDSFGYSIQKQFSLLPQGLRFRRLTLLTIIVVVLPSISKLYISGLRLLISDAESLSVHPFNYYAVLPIAYLGSILNVSPEESIKQLLSIILVTILFVGLAYYDSELLYGIVFIGSLVGLIYQLYAKKV